MCPHIVRIEHAGPGSRARRLVFDDGTESRTTSSAAVKQLALEEGAHVDAVALDASLRQIEYPLAKERALMLLGYREHSSAELVRKLVDAGYPAGVAHSVVERFREVELVDDARFARAWLRSRRLSGYGTRRIVRELEVRGIAPDTISTALEDESDDTGDELSRARAALRGRSASDPRSRERLLRRLVARGFSFGVALKALEIEDIAPPEE